MGWLSVLLLRRSLLLAPNGQPPIGWTKGHDSGGAVSASEMGTPNIPKALCTPKKSS